MFKTLRKEILNIYRKDPSCSSTLGIFLFYPGFQAIIAHRFFHYFWTQNWLALNPIKSFSIRLMAYIIRIITQIEIHPAAKIGPNFFIDHGSGVVIGETTEIGSNVTLYQGVTLGGVSIRKEKRHPTLGSNIVIGAGAKILGNIQIGDYVQIGANSVVLKDVPSKSTVVGIPGRIVKMNGELVNCIDNLEHNKTPDYIGSLLEQMNRKIEDLERALNKDQQK